MAAKTPDPQPNVAPLVALGSFAAAGVATWYGYPGLALIWLGFIVAGWMASPPVMTGYKEKTGRVWPAGPGEEKQQLRYRMWNSLRWSLIMPNRGWFPLWINKRARPIALLEQSKVPGVSFAAKYHVSEISTQFSTWVALGLAVLAAAVPTPEFGDQGRLLNAATVYVLVAGLAYAIRNNAAPDDQAPATGIEHLMTSALNPERRGAAIGAVVGAVIGGAVINLAFGIVSQRFELWNYVLPVQLWQLSLALMLVTAGGILHAALRTQALAEWRELVATRAEWKPRWVSSEMKLDQPPRLLEHDRIDDVVVVDTFEASASAGAAAGLFKLAPLVAIQLGSGVRVAMLDVPDVDAQGQPKVGTAHPLRVRIVTWLTGELPDLSQKDVDPKLVELAAASAMAWVVTDGAKLGRPLLMQTVDIAKAAVTDDLDDDIDWDDEDGEDETSSDDAEAKPEPAIPGAWATQWSVADIPGGLAGLRSYGAAIGSQLGVECIVDPGNGAVYFGALTDGEPEFTDTGLAKHFREMAVEARWSLRWQDVLKQAARQPFVQHEVYATARLPIGPNGSRRATIECQPFVVPQGVSILEFIQAPTRMEPALATTLKAAPFVSVTGISGIGGVKPGGRHNQAIAIHWSDQELPSTPDAVIPSENNKAAGWLLGGLINRAFDFAKLARPEVISVTPMTDKTSKGHMWKIQLKLYGGVTIAEVRNQAQKIRQSLSSGWLRVAAGADGVVTIVSGADPSGHGFVFAKTNRRLSNQDYVTSLDWEQAFLVTKVIGDGGALPSLIRTDVLPDNKQVQVIDFSLPAPLTKEVVKAASAALGASTKNAFIDVRAGVDGADSARILVCKTHPLPEKAGVDYDYVDSVSGVLPFSTNVEGKACAYDAKIDAHVLIAGASGGGKSVALQVFIYPAAVQGAEIYIVDPTKGGADFGFVKPYARAFAATVDESDALMKHVYKEVQRRKALNMKYQVGSYRDLPEEVRPKHIYLIMDEFTSLMQPDPVSKTPSEDPDVEEERQAQLTANASKARIGTLTGKIAREARSAGVTLVLATQKLSAKMLDTIPGAGDLKTNLSRMLMGNATFGERQSALKNAIDAPPLGDFVPRGRGLWETSAGVAEVIQVWFEPSQDTFARMLAERREPLPEADIINLAELAPKAAAPTTGFRDITKPKPAEEQVVVVEDLGEMEVDIDFDALLEAELGDTTAAAPATDEQLLAELEQDDDGDSYAEPVTPAIDLFDASMFEEVGEPDQAPVFDQTNAHEENVVIIDVDGVFSPVNSATTDPAWGPVELRTAWGFDGTAVSPDMGRALGAAPAHLAWLTDWQENANPAFADLIGRGDLPWLDKSAGDSYGWWKLNAVVSYMTKLGMSRAVWMDDHLEDEGDMGLTWRELAEEVFEDLGFDVHFIVPEKTVGLTKAAWNDALAWLERRPATAAVADVDVAVAPVIPTSAPAPAPAVAPLALDDFAVEPVSVIAVDDFESEFGSGAGRRVATRGVVSDF
jgi:hypothetical protein